MACIRRGDGTYEYKFERNRTSNSGEEEDSDEGGPSGVLLITREDIIININKNPKMTRTEKRLTHASVKKRFDLEARMEAKRWGFTDRQKAVRRAVRAIRRGDNPTNWRQVLGGSPLSPEDPYARDSVYSEEGMRFLSTAEAQEKQQETLTSLESQLREDMRKREEDKAVAPSIPATTEGEAVADRNPSQPSVAVAADASAQAKPAMGLASATSTLNMNELTWVVDTGATSHMCKDIELFVQFEPIESSMETAANPLRILGKGTVRFPVKDPSNAVLTVELKDVNYVPRVAHNLFSVIKALVNDGFEISIDKRECTLRHEGGGYVLSAPGGGGVDLYLLRGIGKRECALLADGSANTKEALRWHGRTRHPGVNAIRQLHQIYFDSGAVSFPKSQINDLFCESCAFAKSTHLPFSKAITKMTTRPGEVFHTDIGVLPIASFSGYRYFIVFVDEYTHCVFTFLMRKRDEVCHVYEDIRRNIRDKIKYIYTVVPEYDDEIKIVQSDNGKEYEKLARIIVKYGTRFRFTQAYTPQQNGMAERRIRMVMGKALCLLFEGHLSGALWGEAMMTSTYLINLTPSAAIDMISPYLLWHNRLPRINKLRTFGCAAYAWIPKDKRNKLEAHAVKCIFVGYDEDDRTGYKLLRLLDCEVIHSRDVKFNEDEFPRLADRVLSALPDGRQRTCGCHHCDDRLAHATASVEAILRAEDAATKERTRKQGRKTGEVISSRSSGTDPIDTQSTSEAREIRASEAQLTRTQGAPLPRTSEAIGASEASDAWSGQRTSASRLEQPTQAGSAQVGETLLPRVIESGHDMMVDPQRAVSSRSGETLRTRTDHPSAWSVEAQTNGTAIGRVSDAQSSHAWHPVSVDESRSQTDVQKQPTLSRQVILRANPVDPSQPHGLPVLDERAVKWFQQFIAEEVNKRLHQDKGSGHMSFLFCERVSGEPSLAPSYKCNHQKPSQHCVCCRLRQDAVYATSTGDGVGQCETLCRECTDRQDIVASKVARTAESGGHNRAYPGRQGTVLEQTSSAVCDQTKVSGRQRRKRRRADRLLNEQALVEAQRDSDQVKRRGRSCMCCYEDEGAVALVARAGVSALNVEPTYTLPSEEDAVLDYLRTSGIDTNQNPVKSDKDMPSYEQFVHALLAIKYVNEPQTYKQAIARGEATQWGKAVVERDRKFRRVSIYHSGQRL
ncbi:hypothetical protein PF010_g27389 [Phytophthora fragariae]|uniref:Integrase catalytic domain-containing protein n=1 Tax=Phytophthora fragariae TaxID=53985 RepID=A0A6A4BH02_9STRA|nr:hypothetical protein PF009_g28415 [Phytophthora fragariae]KAE9067630.1 hypothetical protein PF010_g27389 [Phytophthora fragariae]KAE9068236.1 hypothetical protein PF007_g27765 [Phytophthora fragariae]KAE9273654.1 hypothetical protein PF001_g27412 [Phytophthora fragariae]